MCIIYIYSYFNFNIVFTAIMCSIDFTTSNFAKLIHLDLKGAAPKLSYYEQLFPLFKLLGATGLLIEYEDMFPYDGHLKEISQTESYSKIEIKSILKLAEDNNLTVFPLIQTFGHLEFLLKHPKFFELREISRYPNTLCPSHPRSLSVVLELLNQVLELHPFIKWLHLGADEVWHLGECERCVKRMKENNWNKDHLFIDYIQNLSQLIKQKHPNLSLLIWDDMLRNFDLKIIKDSGLGETVEPMIWHYLPPDEFRLKGRTYLE